MAEDSIHVPTADDIINQIPRAIYAHGYLLTAQARSVIVGAIRNGEEPAVIGVAFAAELLRQVVDECADIADGDVAEAVAVAMHIVRGFALGKAHAQESAMAKDLRP